MKRVMLASWATIDARHATIGDRLAVKVATDALRQVGVTVVHATRDQLRAGHDDALRREVPLWVCGPVDLSYDKQRDLLGPEGLGWIITDATLIATPSSVPMQAEVSTARDGLNRPARADFAVLAPPEDAAPVALVLLRGHQPEYRQSPSVHQQVAAAVASALSATSHYPVYLDTRCPPGLSSGEAAASLELLLAHAGVVITSRLHGIIHAVRAGVLPIVIDEIVGGAKVTACAVAFGLRVLGPGPELHDQLVEALREHRRKPYAKAAEIRRRMWSSAQRNLEELVKIVTARVHVGGAVS